jgi:tetratricopeptide (TPR) repeat protein
MSAARRRKAVTEHQRGAAAPAAPSWHWPWAGIAIAVLVLGAAWWSADLLARRARGASLPPLPDLSALPSAAREQLTRAEAAARAEPDSANAVGELGRASHASLLTGMAIDLYARAAALDDSAWRWAYLRGVLLEEHGRSSDAREAFQEMTRKNPAHGLAWFRLAEMAFKDRRLDDAEQAYQRAAQAPPAPAFTAPGVSTRRVVPLAAYVQMGLARVALERGLQPQASAILDAVIVAHPAFGPARTLRAGIEGPAEGRRVPSSARAYVPPADPEVDAVVAMSSMRDLLLKHAALAARGGDREWREYLVRRAAELNPADPNVLMEMAAMLQATNRATEALDILRQHERLVPGDHHTLVQQGRCLADLGRLEEAEAVLRRAVRVRDAAAEYNLGTVLDRQGRGEEARERYERALAVDPFHARALNNLGVWLDRRDQSAAAIAMLQRSVEADPENPEPYSNLGSALIRARRLPEALRALDVAVALAPEAADAHNNRGIALAQSGRLAEAAAEFESALRYDPNHTNARGNLEQLRKMAQ